MELKELHGPNATPFENVPPDVLPELLVVADFLGC